MKPYWWSNEEGTIYCGNALEILRELPNESIHCCVTDPPYELGFMGKKWDLSDIAYNVDLWREVLRVLKPGAHLLAFGGTRTHHRLICAIEDAGFEIRDCIVWAYGNGFPKSLNISKAIDKAAGAEREVVGQKWANRYPSGPGGNSFSVGNKPNGKRTAANTLETIPATTPAKQWEGYGTALKPAIEPICVARKPLDGTVANNVLTHGCGGLNIDGCRIPTNPEVDDKRLGGKGEWHIKREQSKNTVSLPPTTMRSSEQGRFPANLIHDGSPEVMELFPKTISGKMAAGTPYPGGNVYGRQSGETHQDTIGDSGSAARFFKSCPFDEHDLKIQQLIYQAKASPAERGAANNHPTVKPLSLIQYLIRLVCPPGGTVLDCFLGSGTSGVAAHEEGRKFIGIELSEIYLRDIAIPRIKKENQQKRLF